MVFWTPAGLRPSLFRPGPARTIDGVPVRTVTQQWHEVYWKWRSRPFDLVKLKSTLSKWQYALANDGWNSLFWGNHDLPRAVSKYGDVKGYPVESAKMVHQVRRWSSILYSDERRLQWAHCGGKLPEEETQEHYLLVLTPRTSRNV
ncbi:alpha-amylase family glycosyl hydrolase [Rhizobium wenxiniae]|uniref:alpha-amylase family glycosyl hydrolase n=1 Tax=Rhizobium wenxiniae TaxID=1737357 RepID=UPI001FD1C086|nr:alpha-amylase family glycosyl hydrolase [Rhizobium wenxiniae]